MPDSLPYESFEEVINSYLRMKKKLIVNEKAQLSFQKSGKAVAFAKITSEALSNCIISYIIIYNADFLKSQLEALSETDSFDSIKDNLYNYMSTIFENVETPKPIHYKTFFAKEIYKFDDKIYCGYNNKYFNHAFFKGDSTIQTFIIGRSGCGKTATIAEISKYYPLIFIDMLVQKSFFDIDFPSWMNSISSDKDKDKPKGNILIDEQKVVTDKIYSNVACFIIASMLYVKWRHDSMIKDMSEKEANENDEQEVKEKTAKEAEQEQNLLYFKIFLEQMNGAATTIRKFASIILNLNFGTSQLHDILDTICKIFLIKRSNESNFSSVLPIVAFDEFQSFATVRDDVILSYSQREKPDPISKTKPRFYPLNHSIQQTMAALNITAVFSGTHFKFGDLEKLYSPTHKPLCYIFNDFETCTNPKQFLIDFIADFPSDINIDFSILSGRFRNVSSFLRDICISIQSSNELNKKAIIESAFSTTKSRLSQVVDTLCINLGSSDVPFIKKVLQDETAELNTMDLSSKLFDILHKISDNSEGFSVVKFNQDYTKLDLPSYQFDIDEEKIREKLNNILPELNNQALKDTILSNDSNNAVGIGSAFEELILNCFKAFSDMPLNMLPFFSESDNLPKWMSSNFKIDAIVTHKDIEADKMFLEDFVNNHSNLYTLIKPADKTGPDGILFLECDAQNSPNSKNYIMILIGVKYSMNFLSSTKKGDNKKTTNPLNMFSRKKARLSDDSDDSNPVNQTTKELIKSLKEEVFCLRIHVEFDNEIEKKNTLTSNTNSVQVTISSNGVFDFLEKAHVDPVFLQAFKTNQSLNASNMKSSLIDTELPIKRPREIASEDYNELQDLSNPNKKPKDSK